MSEKKRINTLEDLEKLRTQIDIDNEGMITILGRRFILTPQDTFSDMMRAAADLGGINLAKVLMRRAGYEAAYKYSLTMIETIFCVSLPSAPLLRSSLSYRNLL